jgi:myosin heavy subunit
MLYLNALENQATNQTGEEFTLCHEGLRNLVELVPSKQLLRQWESKEIDWEEFRERFKAELRDEYSKESKGEKSRLKGLTTYSLENDVILYSPEPPGEQTYRAVLGEVVNIIWQREQRTERVIDLSLTVVTEQELKALEHRITQLESELNALKEQKKCLQAENQNLQREETDLLEKKKQLTAEINEMEDERTRLESEMDELKQHQEILQVQNRDSQQEATDSLSTKKRLDDEIDELIQQKARLEDEIIQLNLKLDNLAQELEKRSQKTDTSKVDLPDFLQQ